MSCYSPESKPDWKAYALRELDQEAMRQAETHLAACPRCQEELAALRVTLDTLSTLREEEIPRRIAFVSDKVFEPRWWQSFLRPSFGAGALIAAAILVHAFVRPTAAATVDTARMQAEVEAKVESRIESEVSKRVDVAVAKAVAATEQRQEDKTRLALAENEKRYAAQRQADFAAAAANYEMLSKQLSRFYAVNTGLGAQ